MTLGVENVEETKVGMLMQSLMGARVGGAEWRGVADHHTGIGVDLPSARLAGRFSEGRMQRGTP